MYFANHLNWELFQIHYGIRWWFFEKFRGRSKAWNNSYTYSSEPGLGCWLPLFEDSFFVRITRLQQEQKNWKIHKCDTKVFVKIPCNTFDFCYNIIVKRQSPQSGWPIERQKPSRTSQSTGKVFVMLVTKIPPNYRRWI